jgi:predicted permease
MALHEIAEWLTRPFRRHRDDADLKDELQVHLELQAEEEARPGVSVEDARRRARLKLGSTQTVVENIRDEEFITMLESCYRDFTLGLRSLRRNPIFALTAILTIGAGIGANAVIFTLLHGLLFRSLPVKNPEELVRIGLNTSPNLIQASSLPYPVFLQLRSQQKSLTDLSAWTGRLMTLDTDEGAPRLARAIFVSGNGFEVLGVKPYLGRLLNPSDDVKGGPADGWPAVLDYGFWKDTFGGDQGIVGRQIKLSGSIVRVIGVTPPDFHGIRAGSETKVYLPLQYHTVMDHEDRLNIAQSPYWCETLGRLKPGVDIDGARSEIAVFAKTMLRQLVPLRTQSQPWFKDARMWVNSARTGMPSFFGQVYATPLYLMQGLVGIVLILCCVNVGGLMMSQVYARRQEFAVRTALGGARWRLIRQYLTESFVIAMAGAALGAFVAWYGTSYLLPFFRHPNEGVGLFIQPDSTVLLLSSFFAVFTTLLFGALPGWQAGRGDTGTLLKSRTAVGARRQILGRAFVPVQVALSFALVSLATMLSQSLLHLRDEPTGFDLDHVTIQTAPLHLLNLKEDVRLDLYHQFKSRMDGLPGVNATSFTFLTPMTSFQATGAFRAVSEGANPPEDSHMPYNDVGTGYFQTMRTKILSGREFAANERDRSVCILNQAAAAHLFPRREALGAYVQTDIAATPAGPTCRVIGIAQDAKFANLHEPPPRTIYFPVSPETIRRSGNLVFLINASSKVQAIEAYRTAKAELSPSTPFVLFVTLREQMEAALGTQRALSLMSNCFAALALFLSGLGLYGLLSSSVAQRTSEIGVRIALGAERARVLRMVLFDALRLLGAGLAAGTAALFVVSRFTDKLMYGVSPYDPVRLVAITGVLSAIAIISGLLPAIRAASIDPIRALRAD